MGKVGQNTVTFFAIIFAMWQCVPFDPEKSNPIQNPKMSLIVQELFSDSLQKLTFEVSDLGFKDKIKKLAILYGLNGTKHTYNNTKEIASEINNTGRFSFEIKVLPSARYHLWGYAINDFDTTFTHQQATNPAYDATDIFYKVNFEAHPDTAQQVNMVKWTWTLKDKKGLGYEVVVLDHLKKTIFDDVSYAKSIELKLENKKTGVALTALVVPKYENFGFGKLSDADVVIVKFAKPVIAFPLNGSVLDGIEQPIELAAFDYASKYNIELTDKTSGTKVEMENSSDTLLLKNLVENHNYHIKYKVVNELMTSIWSDAVNFTLTDKPGQVYLKSPASNFLITESGYNFEWNAVAGAIEYEIQLSKDYNFVEGVVSVTGSSNKIFASSIPSDCFFWRVRAKNSAKFGSYSEIRQGTKQINAPGISSYCQETYTSSAASFYFCTVNVTKPQGANSVTLDYSQVSSGSGNSTSFSALIYPGQSVTFTATAQGSCSSNTSSYTIKK